MWLDPQQVTKVTLDVDRDRDTGQLQVSITAHARSGPVEGSRTVAEGYRIHGPKYIGHSEPVLSAKLTEEDVATIRAYLDLVSPPPPSGPDLATGADLIAAERRRQIDVEGWTPEHDAKHGPYDRLRELVKAGALIAAEIDRLLAQKRRTAQTVEAGDAAMTVGYAVVEWNQASGMPRVVCVHTSPDEAVACARNLCDDAARLGRGETYTVHPLADSIEAGDL